MPDASQFTLGLFDNTALGWSISTPTFDPASSDAAADHDDEDVSSVFRRHVAVSRAEFLFGR